MKYDVIFICHGNVNRSRAAEAILRHMRPDLNVASFAAGIRAKPGKLISKKMRTILEEQKIPYDKLARSQTLELHHIESSRYAYIMDKNNEKHCYLRFGEYATKRLRLLPELIGLQKIKDPGFSVGIEDHRKAFLQISQCCEKLLLNFPSPL